MTMTMTKSMLSAMRQYMDEMISNPTYSIQELKDTGMIYTHYFDTKDKAKLFARKLCDDTSSMYLYKTNCIRVWDPLVKEDLEETVRLANEDVAVPELEQDEQDGDYNPQFDFSNMTMFEYGKGYVLCPPKDSDYYGTKYFNDGWWMMSQHGWFFKKEHYQWLMDNGAMMEEDEITEDSTTSFDNMMLWEYGAGYLLIPSSDDEHFGEKYFHGGWWMPKQNGWFFKAEFYEMLVDSGVGGVGQEDQDQVVQSEDDDEESPDLSMMTLKEHGKGFLLIPNKNDTHYGQKYFYDGWWMPTQKGWFFKKEFKQWLLEHGAWMVSTVTAKTKAKTKTKTMATVKTAVEDLSNMTLETYKLGYILKTDKSDERFGEKYFMDGFWNESQQGWFFRTKFMDMLVDCGVKVIKSEPVTEQVLEQETITTELSSSITNDSFEYVHGDSEFMTSENKAVPNFKKYGKGWLLKADKHYKYNQVNYFEGGWWMEAKKGWFFKNIDKQKFMKSHFEI